jgi:hypothetical protein
MADFNREVLPEPIDMPNLTRRRDPDACQETWLIPLRRRSGRHHRRARRQPYWQWSCGFYPGSHPRECTGGTAASFEEARRAFEAAWQVSLANRTEVDFEEYRRHRASDAWKRAMWDAGLKLPTQVADGRATCFCGAEIDIEGTARHVYAAHLEMR